VFSPLLEKVVNPLNDRIMGRGYKSGVQLKIEKAVKNKEKIYEETLAKDKKMIEESEE